MGYDSLRGCVGHSFGKIGCTRLCTLNFRFYRKTRGSGYNLGSARAVGVGRGRRRPAPTEIFLNFRQLTFFHARLLRRFGGYSTPVPNLHPRYSRVSLSKLLQMLSKRVTRTLITFMRNVKINATENATVHKPSFKWSGEKLRPETSGAPPLGRSHFQPLLLAEVPLGHAPLHRSAIGP